ncbi:hypothetical protein [Desulfonema magnum]|uniref:Tetratricopeptide repeat-containing n=1 Tax=Desulfonema magnum TaxID=45655 RepID=A0A975BMI9_9BACT|nr:hypothetical protein [Desulfonema magnum]QTA87918.1 tetratricopeptide repeat-containing [Desulfonema magnum]
MIATAVPKKADDDFSRALQIDPNERNTVLNCVKLFKFHNKIQDAKALCSSYLQTNPGDSVITEALRRLEA